MRRFWIIVLTAGLAGAVLSTTAALAQRAACVVFEKGNFGGRSQAFDDGEREPRFSNGWNNRISSVRTQKGCRLTLFQQRDYGGRLITLEGGVRDMGEAWNDGASSLVCDCDQSGRDVFDAPRTQSGWPGDAPDAGGGDVLVGSGNPPSLRRGGIACNFFERQGYRGDWRALRDGELDRRLGGFLRQEVSSVQVARGCAAVVDIGEPFKLLIESDTSKFPAALDDAALSVSCFCQ